MDCLSRTSAKSSVARKKFELAVKKKRLESELELAKIKLKLDELKLISQAQEHLGDLEIQIEEVEQEMGVLSADELELCDNIGGSNTPEPLSPVMLRRFASEPLPVAEPVPVAQPEFHPLPTPRSRKNSACNSNISKASVRPDMTSDDRKYSTSLYPRKFYQDNANYDAPRGHWPKAIVEEVYPDRDGLVRRARLRTASTTLLRDVRKICLLEAAE